MHVVGASLGVTGHDDVVAPKEVSVVKDEHGVVEVQGECLGPKPRQKLGRARGGLLRGSIACVVQGKRFFDGEGQRVRENRFEARKPCMPCQELLGGRVVDGECQRVVAALQGLLCFVSARVLHPVEEPKGLEHHRGGLRFGRFVGLRFEGLQQGRFKPLVGPPRKGRMHCFGLRGSSLE